ncbi:MAG TPA: BadF/BadG/BcrA/BcrD ATPase family protein [Bryobacteraceae bacterium]
MRFFLGVDGGQTSVTAVIGDERGRVLGTGRAGPCREIANIAEAISRAGGPTTFEAACFGLSGGGSDREKEIRDLVRANQTLITHDAWVALAGAAARQPGVVTIAGTGSMAFGKNRVGRSARAGGWGYIFGDEGGAFDIVRQALRAALRYEEGWGEPTALRDSLLKETGAADANDLLHRWYRAASSRDQVAALAPLVDQAAAAGDRVANDILKNAAQQLAALAASVRGQLFPGEPALVSYCGGVFRSAAIRERFRMLVEPDSLNQFTPPRYSPALGALLEAYALAPLNTNVECELTCVPETL